MAHVFEIAHALQSAHALETPHALETAHALETVHALEMVYALETARALGCLMLLKLHTAVVFPSSVLLSLLFTLSSLICSFFPSPRS